MTTNISKKEIKCAVFDLDGTLLNTIKTINHYLNLALEKQGLPAVCEEKCRAFVGDGAVKLIHRALSYVGAGDELFDAVYSDYNAMYDADPYYLTEIYDGIPELLSKLREEGVLLAVLSNKPNFATRAAIGKFFPETFDLCYGAREGVALKPDPEALLSILNDLGVSRENVAYIGDSEPDIKIAENASVALSISVSWGFRSPEQLKNAGAKRIINSPKEFFDILNADF